MTIEPSNQPGERLLRSLIAEQRRDFVFGGVYLALSGICAGVVPQCIRVASNALIEQKPRSALIAASAIALLSAVGAVARVASRVRIFNAGREIEFVLRRRLLAHLHTLGPKFFRSISSGEVMSRATNDLAQVRLLVGFGALNLINLVFAYSVNLPLMFFRSASLTLLALLPFPCFIALTRSLAKSLFTRSKSAQESLGAMSDRAQRALSGMRVVRAYALESQELEAFDAESRRALEANLGLARLRGSMFPLLGAGAAISSLLVIWVGSYTIIHSPQTFTIGDILAFQVHLALIIWPTIATGYILSILQRGRVSMARVAEILDAPPDINDSGAIELKSLRGALSVRGLSFGFDGHSVLQDLSFELPAGGSLAVVGRTASGKSVLTKLLVRTLQTPENTVFLDGHDITVVKLQCLRANVGLAQQEPFLFSSTVARNIAFSATDPDAPETVEKASAAAHEAQILTEAQAMPDGLQTIVGERGVQLSGGQKQRVALARALMAGPRVLILDDPLSAVDARTESLILDAIERAAVGRTLLLVTHRVAAAARCDQVVVLDQGRIVERGTHHQLLKAHGLYSRLAARQALEAELEAL